MSPVGSTTAASLEREIEVATDSIISKTKASDMYRRGSGGAGEFGSGGGGGGGGGGDAGGVSGDARGGSGDARAGGGGYRSFDR